MPIGGLQKTTLIDFPGKVACTVFLTGCNFRCPFCYNREIVLPEEIKKHPSISQRYLFSFLKSRQGLIEGVCLTGGEPTINQGLPEFIKKIKKMGFSLKLDTNGANPKMLQKLIREKLIDYLAMDIKAQLIKEKYEKAAGVKVDLKKIKKSIEIIKNSGIDYEFRTTVVPGIHTKKDIMQIAKDIGPARAYFLQNFQPGKNIKQEFGMIRPYSKEFFLKIIKNISHLFKICRVR